MGGAAKKIQTLHERQETFKNAIEGKLRVHDRVSERMQDQIVEEMKDLVHKETRSLAVSGEGA